MFYALLTSLGLAPSTTQRGYVGEMVLSFGLVSPNMARTATLSLNPTPEGAVMVKIAATLATRSEVVEAATVAGEVVEITLARRHVIQGSGEGSVIHAATLATLREHFGPSATVHSPLIESRGFRLVETVVHPGGHGTMPVQAYIRLHARDGRVPSLQYYCVRGESPQLARSPRFDVRPSEPEVVLASVQGRPLGVPVFITLGEVPTIRFWTGGSFVPE